jgi:hypothetical protein
MLTAMPEQPLYTSRGTKKSMRNEYSIYADRIVLKCRFPFLLKTFVIRREDIVSIQSEKPFQVCRWTFTVLKLDLADLFEHVALERSSGLFKHLRFTPENPGEFVERAKDILRLE